MSTNSRHEKASIAPTIEAHEAKRKSSRKNVEMNNSTAVSLDNLSIISHAGRPVLTTALLARVYGTDDHNIIKNYNSNEGRFIPGKHFYKLEGAELKDFKNYITQGDVVNKHTRQLILWTERGAARHAKMLDTDEAWEVFEKLEDCYFGKAQIASELPVPVNYTLIGTTVGTDGFRCLSAVLDGKVHGLPGPQRKAVKNHVWSQVHKAFSVVRGEDIPANQLDSARQFIAAYHVHEGEFIPKQVPAERLNIHFPIQALAGRREGMLTDRGDGYAWLDVSLEDVGYRHESLCELIIFELQKAGYVVDAAQWELATYRNKLRGIDSFVRGLNRVIEDPQRYSVDSGEAA